MKKIFQTLIIMLLVSSMVAIAAEEEVNTVAGDSYNYIDTPAQPFRVEDIFKLFAFQQAPGECTKDSSSYISTQTDSKNSDGNLVEAYGSRCEVNEYIRLLSCTTPSLGGTCQRLFREDYKKVSSTDSLKLRVECGGSSCFDTSWFQDMIKNQYVGYECYDCGVLAANLCDLGDVKGVPTGDGRDYFVCERDNANVPVWVSYTCDSDEYYNDPTGTCKEYPSDPDPVVPPVVPPVVVPPVVPPGTGGNGDAPLFNRFNITFIGVPDNNVEPGETVQVTYKVKNWHTTTDSINVEAVILPLDVAKRFGYTDKDDWNQLFAIAGTVEKADPCFNELDYKVANRITLNPGQEKIVTVDVPVPTKDSKFSDGSSAWRGYGDEEYIVAIAPYYYCYDATNDASGIMGNTKLYGLYMTGAPINTTIDNADKEYITLDEFQQYILDVPTSRLATILLSFDDEPFDGLVADSTNPVCEKSTDCNRNLSACIRASNSERASDDRQLVFSILDEYLTDNRNWAANLGEWARPGDYVERYGLCIEGKAKFDLMVFIEEQTGLTGTSAYIALGIAAAIMLALFSSLMGPKPRR